MLTSASSATALTPVSNDAAWLTKQRNRINYMAEDSMSIANTFGSTFNNHNFPGSLPGVVNTQFQVCQGLLTVALDFADQFGLQTDALDVYGNQDTLRDKIIRFVYEIPKPTLVGQIDGYGLFGLRRKPPIMLYPMVDP